MDLFNMTNIAQIHGFYKKVRGNFYLLSHSFFKFGDLLAG